MLSCSHDKTIRVWEQTEEIIVLQEEEEIEREKEYEAKLVEMEDVVPGMAGAEDTAAKKTVDSVRSAENIMEAVEILRDHMVNKIDDSKHVPHPLLQPYTDKPLEYFILDTMRKVKSSHLDRSLLMVSFSYVTDILKALALCVKNAYKAEFASRVILYLVQIHHPLLESSTELVPVLSELEKSTTSGITKIKHQYGFNLNALRMMLTEIEEREDTRLFKNLF
uniref:WD_REPEATS_REGION domain-containing protein n=1 Tax=Steinernema glaseri TaxID=37863 RepID=A0A1I7YRF2_9BILA